LFLGFWKNGFGASKLCKALMALSRSLISLLMRPISDVLAILRVCAHHDTHTHEKRRGLLFSIVRLMAEWAKG
jgi:hypothetical protein